jgi:hypothetical protein
MLKLVASYMLMLTVMTFNVGLLIAAVLGLSTGYFIFGFAPAKFIVGRQHEGKDLLAGNWEDGYYAANKSGNLMD